MTTSVESGASWSQTNSYDRYGNRSIVGGGLSFNTNNNRITTAGYSYDAVGNLTNDGAHAYTFDAENKISKVDAVSAYNYDGEGQRVRKLVGENLRFIYDMSGKEVAEFDGTTGALKKEYVYGASGLIPTIEPTAVNADGTRYTTSDHLGSPRVVTNSGAGVVSRHDYKPFGEELGSGIGGRSTGIGFGVADGVRQKFTQEERDNETGLDYFGARYYSSTQGRFTSPDLPFVDQRGSDAQSWNIYAYARNNPLRYVDEDGLKVIEKVILKPYTVSGKTARQAVAQAKNHFGQGEAGKASFKMDIVNVETKGTATSKDATSEVTAVITKSDVELTQTVELPFWHSDNPTEQAKFDEVVGMLENHENEHVQINHEEAEKLNTSLPGTTGTGKGNTEQEAVTNAGADLSKQAQEKLNKSSDSARQRSEVLDKTTKHGTKVPN